MNDKILGILMIACGILTCLAMFRLLIKDMRIRIKGREYEGVITGSYASSHVKTSTSFCPYVKVEMLNKTLKCVRSKTFLFKNKEAGYYKKIKILYNTQYPNECTIGTVFSLVIQFIIMEFIGVLLFVLGIMMFK